MSPPPRLLASPALLPIAFAALGVVFGDIGTSPLYALKEIFRNGMPIDETHVLGVLSLIFWALMLVVTLKYTIFIMRADNKGQGGIMALTALALRGSKKNYRTQRILLALGLLGTALFYGDSMITPAISVLSAIEGLQIIAPKLKNFIELITLVVLSGLFLIQSRGTGQVGRLFAPVMAIWFVILSILGIANIAHHPEVIWALNPAYALNLLGELGMTGFIVIGAVALAVTGAEALYADIGHFGLKPIRMAWFGLVLPALLLNYFGQGALLLSNPEAVANPFYLMAPRWALYPLLCLATVVTVIASQAVISGAFSITRQAIQLGYCPRLTVQHTSDDTMSQVYVPTVNWMLMACVFLLVISFKSSSALASAYGIAVTGTMLVDTILAFIVIQSLWHWRRTTSVMFFAVFFIVDCVLFSSNALKLTTGGWLPLAASALVFAAMTTWIQGKQRLSQYLDEKRVLFEELQERLKNQPHVTVPGTAIYMARSLHGVPQVFLHNLEHNHVIHSQIIVLTIVTKEEPFVDEAHRVKIRSFGEHGEFHRVKLYYGFQEEQDVRRALQLCAQQGLEIDPKTVSFFVGSERLVFRRYSPMAKWQRSLFRFLTHNTSSAADYFQIPVDRVIELGIRIEL